MESGAVIIEFGGSDEEEEDYDSDDEPEETWYGSTCRSNVHCIRQQRALQHGLIVAIAARSDCTIVLGSEPKGTFSGREPSTDSSQQCD